MQMSKIMYNKYSEKKRNVVECAVCTSTQGHMNVQILNNQPRFVCEKHHDSKLPGRKVF